MTAKNALWMLGGLWVVIVVVVTFAMLMRSLSSAITPIEVVEVEPGVKCASMVTNGGVALSCWQVNAW